MSSHTFISPVSWYFVACQYIYIYIYSRFQCDLHLAINSCRRKWYKTTENRRREGWADRIIIFQSSPSIFLFVYTLSHLPFPSKNVNTYLDSKNNARVNYAGTKSFRLQWKNLTQFCIGPSCKFTLFEWSYRNKIIKTSFISLIINIVNTFA